MAQPAHYRQPDAVSFCSIPSSHSPSVQTAVGASICFSCSASFECKGLFQRHDRCCPFSDLGLDLPMRILPKMPAMIASFPINHLHKAIRYASVGGSRPPANCPFYQCRFAGEQRRPRRQLLILRLFLEVLRHKQPAECFWHGRCCSNYSNNYCTAG